MITNLNRFLSILFWDFRIQFRYYFWTAAIVLSCVWLLLLSALCEEASAFWIPVLIFADISNIGVLFIAGILYLERRQGTLAAAAVMPLATGVWLATKLLSLTALCTLCGLALVFFNIETVNWWRVIPAIILCSALFTGIGFLIACPIENIMNYFFAMVFALGLLNIPIFGYVGIFEHWIMWIIPSYPAMLVLAESFQESSAAAYAIALTVLLGWLILVFYLGIRMLKQLNSHS